MEHDRSTSQSEKSEGQIPPRPGRKKANWEWPTRWAQNPIWFILTGLAFLTIPYLKQDVVGELVGLGGVLLTTLAGVTTYIVENLNALKRAVMTQSQYAEKITSIRDLDIQEATEKLTLQILETVHYVEEADRTRHHEGILDVLSNSTQLFQEMGQRVVPMHQTKRVEYVTGFLRKRGSLSHPTLYAVGDGDHRTWWEKETGEGKQFFQANQEFIRRGCSIERIYLVWQKDLSNCTLISQDEKFPLEDRVIPIHEDIKKWYKTQVEGLDLKRAEGGVGDFKLDIVFKERILDQNMFKQDNSFALVLNEFCSASSLVKGTTGETLGGITYNDADIGKGASKGAYHDWFRILQHFALNDDELKKYFGLKEHEILNR